MKKLLLITVLFSSLFFSAFSLGKGDFNDEPQILGEVTEEQFEESEPSVPDATATAQEVGEAMGKAAKKISEKASEIGKELEKQAKAFGKSFSDAFKEE